MENRFKSSLSRRLMAYTALFTFLLLLGFWSILYFLVLDGMEARDELGLGFRTRTIEALLKQSQKDYRYLRRRVEVEWAMREFEHVIVRVVNRAGQVVVETPRLGPERSEMLDKVLRAGYTWRKVDRLNADNQVYQAGYLTVQADGELYKAAVAIDRTDEAEMFRKFRHLFVLLVLVGGGASLWLGRKIVRIALRPIEDVSAIAARVNSESLNERIDVQLLPPEFRDLACTMNAMLDRLSASFNRLSTFSADMAHELRTPLNNLLGSMQVALTRERTPEEYAFLIGSGVEECERLKRIIDSLLFIARSHDPSLMMEKTELRLSQELKNIVSFYEASAEEKNIKLKLETSEELSIPGERTHFQRCIGNLLSNSIRHSPEGSEIILSAERIAEGVCVKVKDFGAGIPESALGKIGERFFRVEPSRSKLSGGTGLGLSIVKSIVEIHGGTMNVQSREGTGTTVSLCLPEWKSIDLHGK